MKTLLIVLLFASFTSISCNSKSGNRKAKTENDWTRENLQGEVLSYSEISYEAVKRFGVIQKGERAKWEKQIRYNQKGNKVEENLYNSDGTLESRLTYKYNQKGKKIEENLYNSKGRFERKRTYKYDQKGNKVEENLFMSNGNLIEKLIYQYDDKGNNIDGMNYDSDGLVAEWTSEYDDKGNEIVNMWYNSSGLLRWKRSHKYDDKGNMIEEVVHLGFGLMNKTTFRYDHKGNKIQENRYNPDGNLDTKLTNKYEFDNQGNWIKRIDFEDEIATFILVREFKYYKWLFR